MPGGPIGRCRRNPKPTSSPGDSSGLTRCIDPPSAQVGAAALKSQHYDMPDLITALPPKPRGRLLAGLLWSVRLADYRVELCWPAGQEVPSPDAVEVRVYPTAFGWFGWCNDEILGQPEISADRRTWTYNHVGVEQIPTVVGRRHRKGSATEMVAVFCEDEKTSRRRPSLPCRASG